MCGCGSRDREPSPRAPDAYMRVFTIACMSSPPSRLPPPPPFARDWALFLDVDGTLLDFAPTPDGVTVAPCLIAALAALQQHLDGAVALVSGRPLVQLDRLFAPLQLPAAGLHGLEWRSGAHHVDVPPAPTALRALLDDAEALVAGYPGAVVEDKGATLALHWRGNPGAEPALRALAEAALPRLPDYRLQPGDHVVELRPAGADKGAAIDALLETVPFRGRRPVFVGDDLTDEHGFEIVHAHDGIAVLVGEREPSIAGYGLRDPDAVRAWLLAIAMRPAHASTHPKERA